MLTTEEYDVIICGGGTSGCAAANRLSKNRCKDAFN